MSLKALIEVVVHFESFRNIELFYQGLYFLKCRLYSEDGAAIQNEDAPDASKVPKDAKE